MRSAAAALACAPAAAAGRGVERLECLPSAPCGDGSLLAAGLGRSRPRTCAGGNGIAEPVRSNAPAQKCSRACSRPGS